MKQLSYVTILNMCLFMLLAGCASFSHVNSGVFGVETDNARVRVEFSDKDRRLIHRYYRSMKRADLPPGLAEKQKLPPGLQKQIRKNGKLPPGIAKRSLPRGLEMKLSPVPHGYVRFRVGGDIILMNRWTDVIVDIIRDVG